MMMVFVSIVLFHALTLMEFVIHIPFQSEQQKLIQFAQFVMFAVILQHLILLITPMLYVSLKMVLANCVNTNALILPQKHLILNVQMIMQYMML